jgi:hypothetical protein
MHHVVLHNASGESITIRLVANFPDYVPEPVPGASANVRQSNPFGAAAIDNVLYVPDASSNSLTTGAFQTLTTFSPLPNTRGFGPPVVEAVPNNIRRFGDGLLVTLLSGFPFPIGGSKVVAVDPLTGNQTPFIAGLTSAIDVTAIRKNGKLSFLTLEFSTDMLSQSAAGQLTVFDSKKTHPTILANCLITPTSMAIDNSGTQIFVTEIFTGRVLKIALP